MPLTTKICGLSESNQIQACINHGANMCGYILFYPKSHRNLNLDKAKELTSLKHSKYNVAVMVNPSRENLESIKDFNFHYYQIYGNQKPDAINDIKPDFIFHLAAQAGVRYSFENPQAYIDSNIKGFVRITLKTRNSSKYGSNT